MFALNKPLEHHTDPLLPRALFYRRLLSYAFIAFLLILISLGIGVLGYRYFEGMAWLDALLNASMILGGMGPVNELHTNGGKVFASFYALFSGHRIFGDCRHADCPDCAPLPAPAAPGDRGRGFSG